MSIRPDQEAAAGPGSASTLHTNIYLFKEESSMGAPLADYVKLPGFDEYKEWFKAFADLKREDGILQVTW